MVRNGEPPAERTPDQGPGKLTSSPPTAPDTLRLISDILPGPSSLPCPPAPARPPPWFHPAPEKAEAGGHLQPLKGSFFGFAVCVSRSLVVCVFFPSEFGFKSGELSYTPPEQNPPHRRAGSASRQPSPTSLFRPGAHTPGCHPTCHLWPLFQIPLQAGRTGCRMPCARVQGCVHTEMPNSPQLSCIVFPLSPNHRHFNPVIITSICGALPTCQTLAKEPQALSH